MLPTRTRPLRARRASSRTATSRGPGRGRGSPRRSAPRRAADAILAGTRARADGSARGRRLMWLRGRAPGAGARARVVY